MYSRLSAVLILLLVMFGLPATAAAQVPTRCQVIGTDGDDVLIGTAGDDVICGLGGADIINGGGGNDLLIGGSGDDVLFGAAGSDVLRGGEGNDRLVGGPGDDVVRGGNGQDELAGGSGSDELWGGNGDDHLRGAGGADVLYGGSGSDVVRGGAGSDRLRGGPEIDVCIDSFGGTNALTCEFGNGGDSDDLLVARALWERRGHTEFVYSMSLLPSCVGQVSCTEQSEFIEVVHVLKGVATSPSDESAFSAEELFDHAALAHEAGRVVRFDSGTGLPLLIGLADGGELEIGSVARRDELRKAFEQARRVWESRSPAEYSYTVLTECFCLGVEPLRVSVSRGEVKSVNGVQLGTAETDAAKTIDEHFENILEILDGHAVEIRATFDKRSGVPLRWSVDQSRRIADDERGVTISDFQVDEGNDVGEPAPGEHSGDDLPDSPTIVSVGGIEVSSMIAEDVRALVDAATEAGLTLGGGGFRDPQRQIDLRRTNCGTSDFAIFEMPADQCSPPTARPGASQHERGLAIDFTSAGRLITSRTDAAFLWLVQHGSAYGLINLPAEPWHWSTTGN